MHNGEFEMKQCPFCKVNMFRPRESSETLEDPFLELTCGSFKLDGHKCKYCKKFYDWECPQCGVLLIYRMEDLK